MLDPLPGPALACRRTLALRPCTPCGTKPNPHLRAVSRGWRKRGWWAPTQETRGTDPWKTEGAPTRQLAGADPRTEDAPTLLPGPGHRPSKPKGEKRKHMASPRAPTLSGGLATPLLDNCMGAINYSATIADINSVMRCISQDTQTAEGEVWTGPSPA